MNGRYFLTICLNPTLQKTIVLNRLWENEVNRSDEYYLDASGKGINVTRVLNQLGEEVIHLTQAGGSNRELFLSFVKKDNLTCSWVESEAEIRFCYTLLNKEKHTTTEIIEEAETVGKETETKIYQEYLRLLPESHTVIISGTKAPGFSNELYPEMVKSAKENGKIVILDLKGEDLKNSLKYRPDIIKPNVSEFIDTFINGFSVSENELEEEALNAVRHKMIEIHQQFGIISVLTKGKYGTFFYENGAVRNLPAEMIEPVNTIGCGDAFTAGFASLWIREKNITDAIKKGMKCAKLNALSLHPGVIK